VPKLCAQIAGRLQHKKQAAHAFNSTPQTAARQVVADLFDLLARGGSVSVRVEGLDGNEHTIEVTARR
jgi:hypothetical protein